MVTLILAAGYATRLYPLTLEKPKALFMVHNAPVITHILNKARELSRHQVYVITNNKFYDQFMSWSQSVGSEDLAIVNDRTNSQEERLGAVGDIEFFIRTQKIADDLLVIGGDNLFDWPLDRFIAYALVKRPHPVIGLYDVKNTRAAASLGVVTVDREQRVTSFIEKPRNPSNSVTSVCIYFFPKQTVSLVRDYLRDKHNADTSGEYIRWLSTTIDVYGYEFSGTWYDIGNKKTLEEAQTKFGR